MKAAPIRIAVLLSVMSCVTLAAVEVWPLVADVRTGDRNGDGLPDLWQHFDAHGRLTKVDVDTNFDGKPDVEEFYRGGVLVRRESDRNFNGQADLIEEFDANTRDQTRSIIDIDYDGTADLLILFEDGRPIFLKRAAPDARDRRVQQPGTRSGALLPLTNPFESDLALSAEQVVLDVAACVGLSGSGGLPSSLEATGRRPVASTAAIALRDVRPGSSVLLRQRSPRAPPAV